MRVAICTVKKTTRVSTPRNAPCSQAVALLPGDLEG
jgi:hypothetical protein